MRRGQPSGRSADGEPVCPKCRCLECYEYASRPIFKCKGCMHQFSVTSGTIFASRKLPVRDYLLAIAIFVNGAKGHSALQLSRDLDVQCKTAFVLAHKLREAMASESKGAAPARGDRVFKLQLPHRALDRDDRARRTDRRAPAIDADARHGLTDADRACARLMEKALRRACHRFRRSGRGQAAGELVSARVRWTPARSWPVA